MDETIVQGAVNAPVFVPNYQTTQPSSPVVEANYTAGTTFKVIALTFSNAGNVDQRLTLGGVSEVTGCTLDPSYEVGIYKLGVLQSTTEYVLEPGEAVKVQFKLLFETHEPVDGVTEYPFSVRVLTDWPDKPVI